MTENLTFFRDSSAALPLILRHLHRPTYVLPPKRGTLGGKPIPPHSAFRSFAGLSAFGGTYLGLFVEEGFAELPVSLSLAPLAVPPTARPRARACFLLVLPRSGPCCRTLSSLLHPPRRPLAPGRRSGSGRDSYESGINSHDSLRPPPPSPAPPGPQPPPGPACCPPPCRCPPLPALPGAVLLSLPAAAPPSLSLARWSAAPLPSSRPSCTGRCPASMLFLSGGGNGGTSSCSPRGSRVAQCLLR